jgi:hypothetical protein
MILTITNKNGRWKSDLVKDHKVMQQIRREALGYNDPEYPEGEKEYDSILKVASKHGIILETIENE